MRENSLICKQNVLWFPMKIVCEKHSYVDGYSGLALLRIKQ